MSSPWKTMSKIWTQMENGCLKTILPSSPQSVNQKPTYHSSIVQLKINTAILLLLIIRKIVPISEVNLTKQRKTEVGEKGRVHIRSGGSKSLSLWFIQSPAYLSNILFINITFGGGPVDHTCLCRIFWARFLQLKWG